ncbi:hypothetical protein BH23ACI1_BH23ACI1_33020 [soil metagenome]
MNRKHVICLAIVGSVATLLAGAALATPGSGVLSALVMARAGFADNVDFMFRVKGQHGKTEVLNVRGAQDVVVQEIKIAPLGHTGWHSHPGPVVVLVKAGALTFYSADDPTCTARTYFAGQAFVDSGQGHAHIARNESADETLELWATYFDVPVNGGFRIDVPDPGNCTF